MKIFSKQNLYLTLWIWFGVFFAILDMSIISWLGYYLISFNPAKYWEFRNEIFVFGLIFFGFLLIFYSYLAVALGRISWQKIYVEGVRGKKYIAK
jgi:hypothetical protein